MNVVSLPANASLKKCLSSLLCNGFYQTNKMSYVKDYFLLICEKGKYTGKMVMWIVDVAATYLHLSALFQVSLSTSSWIGIFQGIMYIQKVLYICYHFSIPLVRSPLTFALYFLKYQFLSSKVIFHTFSNDLQFWGVKSACIGIIV